MPVLNRIQFRRGTNGAGATQWTNEILHAGEVGYETDTGKFKIGDGITQWSSLPYASILPSELSELVEDIIGSKIVAGNSGLSISYQESTGQTSISLNNHQHNSTDIQDFNQAVNNLIPVKDIDPGSGISVTSQNGTYTISLNDPTINVSDITGLTATATELNYLSGATPGTSVANTVLVVDSNKDLQGIRNLVVSGDLTVNGTSTIINSVTVSIDDKNLELGSIDNSSDITADGGGITLKGTNDIEWKWFNASQSWTSSEHINLNNANLTYKINGVTVIGGSTIGAAGYSLAGGVIIDGGTP